MENDNKGRRADHPREKSTLRGPRLSVTSEVLSEKRRLPRLSLTSEQFRLTESGRLYSVTDLSESGMGLWLLEATDVLNFTLGSVIEGFLNLRREKYWIRARVRNLRRDCVGAEFEDLSSEIQTALVQFLDPEVLGAEMKAIPSNEPNTLWFHGPSGTDLLIRRAPDGQFRRLSLYVLGSLIQWEDHSGVLTGRVASSGELSEVRGIVRLETLVIYPDAEVDPGKLSIAKKVILSSNLSQDLKNRFIRQLEGDL